MKILLITFGAALCASYVAGSMLDGAAGMMGIEVDKKCNAIIDKWTDYAKKKIWKGWLVDEKCAKVKCKPSFEHFEPMWPTITKWVDKLFAWVASQKGPNIKKLEGSCKTLQGDINGVLWKFANQVVKKCVTGPKSPARKDMYPENPCKITEEKMKSTGNCIKEQAMPKAMEIAAMKMDPAKKCFNEILKKYCNDAHLEKWFKEQMENAAKDRKIMGDMNAFNMVDEYMKDCKPHPK